MNSILVFLALSKYCSAQIFASGSSDHEIIIWNQTSRFSSSYMSSKTLKSLEYDSYNSLILAGCREKSIFLWNFLNNTQRTINTNVSVDSILSLNSTHFMIGSKNILFIYKIYDSTNQTFVDNFGNISDMKLLKEDNLALIGTNSSMIVVFNLSTRGKTFIKMNINKVVSIDCLNRNFIVSQCQDDQICLFNLNYNNSLERNKSISFGSSNLLFSINILNQTYIIFGIHDQNLLAMWDLSTNSLNSQSTKNKVLVIEILDQSTIGYADNDEHLRWRNNSESVFIYDSQEMIFYLKSMGNIPKMIVDQNSPATVQGKVNPTFELNSKRSDKYFTFTNQYSIQLALETFDREIKNNTFVSTHEMITRTFENINIETGSTKDIRESISFTTSSTTISNSNLVKLNKDETTSIYFKSFPENILTSNSRTFQDSQSVQDYSKVSSEAFVSKHFPNSTANYFRETISTKNQKINFYDQKIESVLSLMTNDVDMNACLVNCSGHGFCKMINQALYSCECFENYAGENCQIDILPCSSNPCKNNGTCVNNLVEKKFKCECYFENNKTSLYYGQNCEKKIDICSNETCTNHGVCYDVNDEIKCKCFAGYSGDKCELASDEIKIVKSVITVASIIAIAFIVLFFVSIVIFDLLNLAFGRPTFKLKRKSLSMKKIPVRKFIYHN